MVDVDAKDRVPVRQDRNTAELAAETSTSRWRLVVHYAGMPVFITVVLVALYQYVQGQPFDSVTARTLTAPIIRSATLRHAQLTAVSTVLVIAVAVPLGVVATRPGARRLAPFIVGLGNLGQAIPSLGTLAVLFLIFPIPFVPALGFRPVVIALVAYSLLPILRNTIVGIQQVDPSILEAGRGMGMSNWRILRRIELPLAVPVILAGVRTALVLNVGTATLAFLFGGGGLGTLILRGFQLNRTPVLVTGAVLTAALALLIDYVGSLAEESLTPSGL